MKAQLVPRIRVNANGNFGAQVSGEDGKGKGVALPVNLVAGRDFANEKVRLLWCSLRALSHMSIWISLQRDIPNGLDFWDATACKQQYCDSQQQVMDRA